MKTSRLAEIFGTISVVLSLIFVGVEINQNTNLSRNQAYLDFSERVGGWSTNRNGRCFA